MWVIVVSNCKDIISSSISSSSSSSIHGHLTAAGGEGGKERDHNSKKEGTYVTKTD